MRTLRLLLMGLVIPGLLAALSVSVAAQEDEQEPSTTTYATHVTGVAVPTPEGDSYLMEGDSYAGEMDWSDPRLPSHFVYRVNAEAVPGIEPDGSGGAVRIAWQVRLEGLEGSWSGTGHSLAWMSALSDPGVQSDDARTEVSLLLLDGEGAYEGLSAWLTGPRDGDAADYEGFIFEDPLTMPDPIEAE